MQQRDVLQAGVGKIMNRHLLLITVIITAGGCQTYEPRPLALESYARTWDGRVLDVQTVRDYAQALVESTDDAAPFDIGDGITLVEAEALALHFNQSLRAARAAARVPLASAEQAGWWPDPQFQASVLRFTDREGKHRGRDYSTDPTFIEDPWIVEAGVGLTIPVSGRLAVEKDLAWTRYDASWHEIVVAEWQLLTQLRDAWLEWSTARERVAVTATDFEPLRRIADIAERIATAGEMKATDARVLKIELARQQAELLALQAAEQRGRLRILALMGVSPRAELTLQPEYRLARVPADEAQRRTSVISAHPRVRLAEARYETAEQQLRLAVRSQYPDLQIGPNFSFDEGFYRLGLGLAVPIPLWNRNRQGIAEAYEQREAARAQAEGELQAALSRLAELDVQLSYASEQREFLETHVGPVVDQQLADSRKLLNLGEVNVLLLRDAVISSLTTKLNILDAKLAEARAANELSQMLEPRWVTPPGSQTTED